MLSILSYQCLGLRRKPYKVWLGNNDFFRGEVTIAGSVFDVTLLEGTFLFCSHADKEVEGFGAKHWRISLKFRPDTFFMISENNYVRLGPDEKGSFCPSLW